MKIKIIEKTHELDLADALNEFIEKHRTNLFNLKAS